MKLKILLFLICFSGVVNAQQIVCDYPEDVINSLIITEVRMDAKNTSYVEVTNVGKEKIRLSEFKFGNLTPWSASSQVFDICYDGWNNSNQQYVFLPDRELEPGKSFVLTFAYDYSERHYKEGLGRQGGSEKTKQIGMYEAADKLIHVEERILGVLYDGDSVTTAYNDPEQLWHRGNFGYLFDQTQRGGTFYLEHHFAEGDSAIVDQIGGIFDSNGRNFPIHYDIAGVKGALEKSIVLRKANVKKGNIDFSSGRGIGLDDSEWMVIGMPEGYNIWRNVWWITGNHGDYTLDENTLEPLIEDIIVDFSAKKITVPWGIRRLDEIMRYMKKKPGVAWQYDLNPMQEDSLFRSIRTGDQLTIYVAGNTLYSEKFELEVKSPAPDDNMVIPIDHAYVRLPGETGPITTRAQSGILSWPRVTKHENGIDSITGVRFGLPFDLRSDTLLKYLEKPANASWEFVWADGIERPDLIDGDKLKIVSASGKVKEYYIQVQPYWPNNNADLSSITWPDIPAFYRGLFGWKGDTIPNFSSGATNYRIEVPFDVEGVPSLKAKTSYVNAEVKVSRAKSLSGSIQDRTVIFEVTAEDDTTQKSYSVELFKAKTADKIESFSAEPFISEFIGMYPSNGMSFLEIYNPGNQPIDLRNYMIAMDITTDLYNPIKVNTSWSYRYYRPGYIPGLKHVDQQTWTVSPKKMLPDPEVNPIVPGGGTFVLALIDVTEAQRPEMKDYFPKYDVQFADHKYTGHPNPWNEPVGRSPLLFNGNRKFTTFLYKVLNDSIKLGTKPIGDVNDFQVIDVLGMADDYWKVGNWQINVNGGAFSLIRKPNISHGNPEFAGSFGTNDDDCEWIYFSGNYQFSHIPIPARYAAVYGSLNQHYFIEPTYFRSTVNSSVYKVSDGFGPGESILGLKAGVNAAEFLANINKEDDNQTLTLISAADGAILGMDAVLSMNDKLVVVSADQQNTTVYRLDVTVAGLSNNAYLTSSRYKINVSVDPKSGSVASAENDGGGSVSGFDYGTTIKTLVDNIHVPAGATLTVIDGNGAYVPYQIQNFDTTYVSVTVNPDIFFDVVAEDNVTRIVYQLQPNTSENDAFILSDLYEVSQMDNLIHFVPRGTNFEAFLANIIPSLGASLKLIDKMGFERKQGNIREDDKVVVTSANGQTTRVYYISFLATATIPQTTYLAYVLSEAYSVNQVDYIIAAGLAPLTSETLMDEFISYLTPSMGATMVVVDKNGEVRTSGDLNDGDKLVVTSADGKISTAYTLTLDITANGAIGMQQQIAVFPNPASNNLHVQGVETGNRIQVYSVAGTLVCEMKAQSTLEVISIEQVPSGMFVIVVCDDQKVLGRFKAIRK